MHLFIPGYLTHSPIHIWDVHHSPFLPAVVHMLYQQTQTFHPSQSATQFSDLPLIPKKSGGIKEVISINIPCYLTHLSTLASKTLLRRRFSCTPYPVYLYHCLLYVYLPTYYLHLRTPWISHRLYSPLCLCTCVRILGLRLGFGIWDSGNCCGEGVGEG